MILRRVIELIALVMIGDGVAGLLRPRRHSLLWKIGPEPFRRAMHHLAENPDFARWAYAAEIGVGALIATEQAEDV